MQQKRFSRWWIVPSFMAASLMAAGPSARLVDAVKNTDKAAARVLVEQHVDVNAPETDGTTALHWAARWDDLETAELLIRNGANAKAANRYNVMPLSLACENGNAAMIALLLKAGADPNTALPEGETALMTASRTGKVDAVKLLIAHGADPNAKEKGHGQTALMWAAAEGNTAVVETLIEHGADMHARSEGFTPLLFAVREGRTGVVRAMLKAGVEVNETWQGSRRASGSGSSGLVLAVANAHYELALALLEAGADPNAAAQGWTALHQITWVHKPGTGTNDPAPEGSGNVECFDFIRKLVAHGANVNARMTKNAKLGPTDLNMIGATPFLMAARTADAPLMRLLAELGADPLLPNADNTTPLAVAAGIGTHSPGEDAGTEPEVLEAVKVALELGGDVNAIDNKGETAIHGTAYKQVPSVAQYLIDHGAKVEVWNRKDKEGVTPLRIAEGAFVLSKLRSPSPGVAAVLRKALSDAGLPTEVEPQDLTVLRVREKL